MMVQWKGTCNGLNTFTGCELKTDLKFTEPEKNQAKFSFAKIIQSLNLD